MKPSYHPLVRQSLVAALVVGFALGGALLPSTEAETKKKSGSGTHTAATPKKKKPKSDDDEDAVSTPKSSPKKSTPRKAKDAEASPSEKKSGSADKEDSSSDDEPKGERPSKSSENSAEEKEAKSTPAKATPAKATSKTTGEKKKSSESKQAASDQPAPDLPKKDAASKEAPGSADATPKKEGASEVPSEEAQQKSKYGPNVSIDTSELLGFPEQPVKVQQLIESALKLAQQKLTYTYGSADPSSGGMDCSGAIYYLLRQQGFQDVPRDASGQYVWARKHGQFFAVISKKADSFEFGDLLPGDLLFWNGTYSIDRDPPVTHSMIYLGVQKKRGQHVMWGSSDGRTYDGKARYGVSVFDFKMPRVDKNNAEPAKTDFLGYARIPGLREQLSTAATR